MAVQTAYTEAKLQGDLKRMKAQGKSLRAISALFPGTTFGDIQRALKGQFPKRPAKRMALHLPALAPAPVCLECGIVHTTKRCPNHKADRKDLFSIPTKILRLMVTYREEIK